MSTSTVVSLAGQGTVFTTAGGGSIPAGWYLPAFNDSGWGAPVLQTHFGSPIPGSQLITDLDAPRTNQPYADLYRRHFTLASVPPAAFGSASIHANSDDKVQAIYVNGTPLTFSPATSVTVTVPFDLLVSGDNLIAIETLDILSSFTSLTFILTITFEDKVWFVIDEPIDGLTNQTFRVYQGDGQQNSFTQQIRQRGQATRHLRVFADDPYQPTRLSPVFIYDQSEALGYTTVFAGLIQDIEIQWIGTDGDRYIIITAVSLESVFDTVYAQPRQYVNQTCGDILTALFDDFETGCPVTLGTIAAGATIPLLNTNYEKLSDLFDQLATTSGFTWYVDVATQTLFFDVPSSSPAPFTVTNADVDWESIDWKVNGADYRNRQAVRLSYDAFPHSKEFFEGSGQQQITLARPARQVTNAWATLSTCNTATASFSGQPSPGDTVTISIPSGAGFGWQASHVYGLGGKIVVDGFVQEVTQAGTSGGFQPTFATIATETTVDNSVIWTSRGAAGLSTGNQTYTFESTIDNEQFGRVKIGINTAATTQNLFDAINATVTRAGVQLRGVTYSLPTWENSLVNAIELVGTGFTAQQKSAGTGWISQLTSSGSAFAWSDNVTSGGTSPQGSLGPGEGATISLQVYQVGTSTAAPGVAYQEGSAVINLATPLNAGSNLNVEYTREDGDIIEVEDTALVIADAAITHGTGKNQQITDASTQGLVSVSVEAGLQLAQQALEAYKVPPTELTIKMYRPGLQAGQQVTLALTKPIGATTLLNGDWVIEEVNAEFIPGAEPWLDGGPYGHYHYTVKFIDLNQIGSYLDFWEGLASSGGGGGSGLSATSGGGMSVPGTAFPLDFSNKSFNGQTFAAGDGVAYDLASWLNSTVSGCTFNGRFPGANFRNTSLIGGCVLSGEFSGCDFTATGLTNISMSGSQFRSCNFTTATFNGSIDGSGSNFTGCDFTHSGPFTGADFHGATFKDCIFVGVDFSSANLQNTDFSGCEFVNCTFTGTDFTGSPGSADTFLQGCSFVNALVEGTIFDGADLSAASFFQAQYISVLPTFDGCNLTGVRFNDLLAGGPWELVVTKTVSYTLAQWDANKIISVLDASPHTAVTITLPATAPSSTWQAAVQNGSTSAVTLSPNGRTLDGIAGSLTIPAGSGLQIYSDGSDYFTERGMGAGGGSGTVTHTGALTVDQPVFGNGAADIKAGTKTGNTNTVVSATGAATSGYPLLYDAAGNAVARQPRGATTVVQLADATTNPTTGDLAKFDAAGNIADSGILASAVLTNPMTTKGDVIVAATSGVPARLAVGANGQALTADSTATNGVKWATQIYDVVISYPGAQPNAAVLQIVNFTRAVSFAANFAGSSGHCANNPTATATYTVNKNGSAVGTVVISTSGTFSFTTSGGSPVSFAASDTLSILTPGTDATLGNVTVTLAGTR